VLQLMHFSIKKYLFYGSVDGIINRKFYDL